MYPYFLFAAIHHLKSSPTFSVRPCSSVGRVTVDLIRRSLVRFLPRPEDFFFASCGSLFPFTRANAQWVIHGLRSTIIYTSELILCSTKHKVGCDKWEITLKFKEQTALFMGSDVFRWIFSIRFNRQSE